jgi:alpha-beta hydrolase superfamily lysophospholipase
MKKIIFLTLFFFNSLQAYGEAYIVEEIEFISHGDKLSGSIVFPKSGEIHSAVVFVHGSGEQVRNMHWAERFASEGIAALVYD